MEFGFHQNWGAEHIFDCSSYDQSLTTGDLHQKVWLLFDSHLCCVIMTKMIGLVFGTGYPWLGVHCIKSASKISTPYDLTWNFELCHFLVFCDTTVIVTSCTVSKLLMTWSHSFMPLDHHFKRIPMCTHVWHIMVLLLLTLLLWAGWCKDF